MLHLILSKRTISQKKSFIIKLTKNWANTLENHSCIIEIRLLQRLGDILYFA